MALSMPSFCQVIGPPKEVPKSYWKELDRAERKEVKEGLKDLKQFQKSQGQQFDFLIPEVPLPVTESIQAEGNWSRAYLEIPEHEDEIRKRLKGKFCMAILDTGEPDHSEVVKYKMPGHVSKSYTGEPVIDGHFHATHVAGSQVAKVGDDYIGIANVAAAAGNLRQVYYKVCTNQGGCSFTWISSAIRDFVSYYKKELKPNGWDAGINMSIGGSAGSADLSRAMKEAVDAGIVIFASAGNNGQAIISYPAKDVSAKAVGAHDNQGRRASFSNWGPEMFVNAPGVLVYSTCLGDTECAASGTSMSSPQAAAVYALLKIMNPGWTPQQTLDFMARHATDAGDPGFDDMYGYGIPKIGAYLDAMGDEPEEPEPDPPTCDDGKKNGREKGIDCGGPDCPPCDDGPDDPQDPEKPPYRQRTLPIEMEGNWVLGWWPRSTNNTAPEIYNLDAIPQMSPAGRTNIKVTHIGFEVDSETEYAWEYEALRKNASLFFRNRAIGTPAGWDVYDAGRYVLFFLDYYASNSAGKDYISQKLRPSSLTFEWEGATVTMDPKDLADYQK